MGDDEAIEHSLLSKQIENAQKRVESRNYGIRKTVLQFDDVMNQQREVIYGQRREVLDGRGYARQHPQYAPARCSTRPCPASAPARTIPTTGMLKGLGDYLEQLFLEGRHDARRSTAPAKDVNRKAFEGMHRSERADEFYAEREKMIAEVGTRYARI